MKSIPILSHFHSGIAKGWRVPAGRWCSAFTRRQTSQFAIYWAISLFILVHQNLWRRSWYILVLPGWMVRGDSWASLRINCRRCWFLGTTRRFSKYTTPWSFVEKQLAPPLAMFSLILDIPLSRFWAAMIWSVRVGFATKVERKPWGTMWRLSFRNSSWRSGWLCCNIRLLQ